MHTFELCILALGLSMDAFAVSVCKGLAAGRVTLRQALTTGVWFGGFQALMPCVGWLLGVRFQDVIAGVDHWIAFVLLGLIGLNMLREASHPEVEPTAVSFAPQAMLPAAIATSIDALTVGITFAVLQVDLIPAVTVIGTLTLLMSAIGVRAGGLIGERGKARAERFGGWVLILMGLHILLEHLGVLP